MVKNLIVCASLLISASSFAAPNSDSIYTVQINGHFWDGLHEIIEVVPEGDTFKVVYTSGSYDFKTSQLQYSTQLLASGLSCSAVEDHNLTCSRDDLYVDGPRVVYEMTCNGGQSQHCKVVEKITVRSWTTGELETDVKAILENAEFVK